MKRVAVILAVAAVLAVFGCSNKKKREPGPLRVWLIADGEAEFQLKLLAEDFSNRTGIPVEVEFRPAFAIRDQLETWPEDPSDGPDLVEADLFDLKAAAPAMIDLTPNLGRVSGISQLYQTPLEAGTFGANRVFIPWRLRWPAMIVDDELSRIGYWSSVASFASNHPGEVAVPCLDDRELFVLVSSIAWSEGASVADPSSSLSRTFEVLTQMAEGLSIQSQALRAGSLGESGPGNLRIFFEWPQGLLPMVTNATIALNYEVKPLPCKGDCVPYFGRYLGVPRGARHVEDAIDFISFLTSPYAQNKQMFASPWLPVRADAWRDLGARANAWHGFALSAPVLRTPETGNPRLEAAVAKAARLILFEEATPAEALEAYRESLE